MINRLKIKGLRVQNGYTQEELSKKIGISLPAYARKERGEQEFTESEITSLAKNLNVSPSIFFEN